MRELDRIDGLLLSALQKNARLPNKELAARAGLAPSTTLERVRRLHEEKVLQGYHARVDPRALGIRLQAMVAIRLSVQTPAVVEAFRAAALARPEVVALYHVGGANDFLIHVAVRDTDHLRDLTLEAFTVRPEVGHIETALIYEYAHNAELPNYAGDSE